MKTKEIIEKYPELFGTEFDPKKTLMCFGFEISSFWRDIIISYLDELSDIVKRDKLDDFIIVQVKEKFGYLSLYYYKGNDAIREVVQKISEECSHTCEKCGSSEGKHITTDGWFRVECEQCQKLSEE